MSGWGNEDESSSSNSTISSSQSRRRDTSINVLEVRDRIVKRIMEKKRREQEEQQREEQRASSSQVFRRPSRAPLTDLPQVDDDQMELTLRQTPSSNGRENQDTSANLSQHRDRPQKEKKSLDGSPRSRPPMYSSTPLTGRFTPASSDGNHTTKALPTGYPAHRVRSPAKSQRPKTSVIPESEAEAEAGEEEEAEAPSLPRATRSTTQKAPTPSKRPTQKKAGKPKADPTAKPPSRKKSLKLPDPELAVFPPSDDDAEGEREDEAAPPAAASDAEREQEQASIASTHKSSGLRSALRSPKKSLAPTPSTKGRPSQADAAAGRHERPATRQRKKSMPKRKSPESRVRKMFTEIRQLQNAPGFLIPRLPFMRVVREIASQVAVNGSDYRFTVDAMEALQTAAEYYVTNVFTDAAKLANHARRVTVMPRDLELLRTLRIVDT